MPLLHHWEYCTDLVIVVVLNNNGLLITINNFLSWQLQRTFEYSDKRTSSQGWNFPVSTGLISPSSMTKGYSVFSNKVFPPSSAGNKEQWHNPSTQGSGNVEERRAEDKHPYCVQTEDIMVQQLCLFFGPKWSSLKTCEHRQQQWGSVIIKEGTWVFCSVDEKNGGAKRRETWCNVFTYEKK